MTKIDNIEQKIIVDTNIRYLSNKIEVFRPDEKVVALSFCSARGVRECVVFIPEDQVEALCKALKKEAKMFKNKKN